MLDPSEDPYGQEMALYLNEEDVLKPGETNNSKQGILKYCAPSSPKAGKLIVVGMQKDHGHEELPLYSFVIVLYPQTS